MKLGLAIGASNGIFSTVAHSGLLLGMLTAGYQVA